ncbi:MAG: SPOR domain-containing protein [Dysgonamonadaceae bacterium]|jgi:nucleoid DNA-binding protein|nr:SPOR domain-containing protein [Dysgonamonadaceae bacterium]
MQKEFLHLAYLLTKHECVTLPGFGAFVVQPVPYSEIRIPGSFPARVFSLSFNPELSHNDGLLVSSIQKEQQISYNEANLKVNRFVGDLSRKLLQQEIFIPGVGKLHLMGGRIVFSPDDFLSCNASNYGLTNFFMPSLSDLSREVIRAPFNNKGIIRAVTSAAAVAVLFLVFSTPLSDYQAQTQSAAVISLKREEAKTLEMLTEDSLSEEILSKNTVSVENFTQNKVEETVVESETAILNPQPNSRSYFIVIGSLPSLQTAQDQLRQVKTKFNSADIVGNGERFRIYVGKFSDKKEAESYLETFRDANPDYKNAWLLSQKNV